MATDNRDWYTDRIRKKTGYTEKADFRVSYGELERRKHRLAWFKNIITLVACIVGFFVLIAVLKAR